MRRTEQHTPDFSITRYKWEGYIAGKCLSSTQRFSGDLVCSSDVLSQKSRQYKKNKSIIAFKGLDFQSD